MEGLPPTDLSDGLDARSAHLGSMPLMGGTDVMAGRARRPGGPDLRLQAGAVVDGSGQVLISLADLLGEDVVEDTVEWRHARRTPSIGRPDRVALACTRDVGTAINPQAVIGQIQGGTQGLGWRRWRRSGSSPGRSPTRPSPTT